MYVRTPTVPFVINQHENYGSGSGGYPNDVALLEISGANFPSNAVIQVASSGRFADSNCVISGFGVTGK